MGFEEKLFMDAMHAFGFALGFAKASAHLVTQMQLQTQKTKHGLESQQVIVPSRLNVEKL